MLPEGSPVSTLSDLALWSLLVGTFLPLLVSVVQQPRWSHGFRAVVAVVSSCVAAAGTAMLQGDLTGRRWLSSALLVTAMTLTMYRNFWRQTVAPAIERATSPTPSG